MKVSRADAATRLLSLLDYRGAIAESGAVRHALTLYRDHNVDFVDALVAATAREHKWQVFGFDRDLRRPEPAMDEHRGDRVPACHRGMRTRR